MARKRKTPNNHQPPPPRKKLSARTKNQKKILKSISINDFVLFAGPAGSGKTHLSVGSAVEYLLRGDIEKIVITRPIVQAGERIGYLPGTAEEKLDPYLYPIYDEFSHFLSNQEMTTLKNERKIEIVPLALMRGRNFHNAFIIGDEMQNATFDQIKMFITRTGLDSKLTISGDLTQSDLPKKEQGAFKFCLEKLVNIDGIGICYLEKVDILRNKLIPVILEILDERQIYNNSRHEGA